MVGRKKNWHNSQRQAFELKDAKDIGAKYSDNRREFLLKSQNHETISNYNQINL